jgi:hypothetical protein
MPFSAAMLSIDGVRYLDTCDEETIVSAAMNVRTEF